MCFYVSREARGAGDEPRALATVRSSSTGPIHHAPGPAYSCCYGIVSVSEQRHHRAECAFCTCPRQNVHYSTGVSSAKNRKELWLQAIKRAAWGPNGRRSGESLCSAHVISGWHCAWRHIKVNHMSVQLAIYILGVNIFIFVTLWLYRDSPALQNYVPIIKWFIWALYRHNVYIDTWNLKDTFNSETSF